MQHDQHLNDDPTEEARRRLTAELNANQRVREELAREHGQCWDTDELQRDFEVLGFMAPFCIVRRKSDGLRGTLLFQHQPRFYFSFVAEPSSSGWPWTGNP